MATTIIELKYATNHAVIIRICHVHCNQYFCISSQFHTSCIFTVCDLFPPLPLLPFFRVSIYSYFIKKTYLGDIAKMTMKRLLCRVQDCLWCGRAIGYLRQSEGMILLFSVQLWLMMLMKVIMAEPHTHFYTYFHSKPTVGPKVSGDCEYSIGRWHHSSWSSPRS